MRGGRQQETVGGVVIEADAAQARARRETTWTGAAVFVVLVLLGLIYYFYQYQVTPRRESISRLDSQISRERSNLQGMRQKSESLHEMIELNQVMDTKWDEVQGMFFTDGWDVIDNLQDTVNDLILENGLVTGGFAVQLDRRGTDLLPISWDDDKLAYYFGTGSYQISDDGPSLNGDLLINPIPFEGAMAGNYDKIQKFFTSTNYESDYFIGVYEMSVVYFTEETSLITIQPVGTWEFVVFQGAAYWLKQDGTPNTDPGQYIPRAQGGRRGGPASSGGGGGALSVGG